jgi:glycosyltransferase involved in cell wall biosynthesis
MNPKMKIAIVYDRINKWGGAERVLQSLHEIWPEAPLYSSVYNPDSARWAENFSIVTSFIQKFPYARIHHEYYPWLMTFGFESFNFDEYDVVITVTSAEAKGIITKPETLHICYCLTPTRYLWSHRKTYLKSINIVFKKLAEPVLNYLEKWDKIASTRPDHYISISKHIQKRVRKYYGRESEIIYPPAELNLKEKNIDYENKETGKIDKSEISIGKGGRHFNAGSYYLVVSRLVHYKRVDIVIRACNKLKLPLIIIGKGSEQRRLMNIAGSTVTFIQGLTDRRLLSYYQSSVALIMAQDEDFGLTGVEAQLAGVPVITYNISGAAETIIPGKTGEMFKEQTVDSLVEVLKKFDHRKYKRNDCINNAEKFSKKKFKLKFKKRVEKLYKNYKLG